MEGLGIPRDGKDYGCRHRNEQNDEGEAATLPELSRFGFVSVREAELTAESDCELRSAAPCAPEAAEALL